MTSAPPEAIVQAFPSFTSLRVGHNLLLKKYRASGDTPEMLQEIKDFLQRGIATGALIDIEADREAAQSLLDYWATVLIRQSQSAVETSLADFDINLAPELPDELCPYRGLNAFDEDDWAVFFGRKRFIETLVTHLQSSRLLCLVGPSGSGKSSTIRAGLLPRLKENAIAGSSEWQYLHTMVPGSKPLENLARLLRPGDTPNKAWEDEQVQAFMKDPQHLANLLSETFEKPTVLVVDQFEEVFTLCIDSGLMQAFVNNLMGAMQAKDYPHIVILTMRTDFENKITLLPEFQPIFEKNLFRVSPLNASELRAAIEEPASRIGLKFEEGVVDALLNDILGEPAALPLLQFTLLRLWDSRERNRITFTSFHKLGGARQALARSADEFYNNLIPEEQVTARRILMRMVRPGEGLEVTSNRVRRDALHANAEAVDRIDRVIEKFVKARLLKMTKGDVPADDQVEVAHEALVRNWPMLVSWLDEERSRVRERQRLTAAVDRWVSLNRNPAALMRGVILEEAKNYEDLTELETTFLRESEKAQENEISRLRRRNQIITAAASFAFVFAISAIMLFFQSNKNAKRAEINSALAQTKAVDAQVAAETAISAQRVADAARQDAQNQQITAIALKDLAEKGRSTAEAGATKIAAQATEVSIKATAVATAQVYGNQQNQLARLRLGEQAAGIAAEHPDLGILLALEAYQRTPVAGETGQQTSFESLGKLMDSLRAQPYIHGYLRGSSGPVTQLAYVQDANQLVSSSADGVITVWDSESKSILSTIPLEGFAELNNVTFNATDNILAAGGCATFNRTGSCTSGLIRFTNLEDQGRKEVNIFAHKAAVSSMAFTPRGDWLVSGGADGVVLVWRVPPMDTKQTDFKPILSFIGHKGPVTSVAFSPDGKLVASGGIDGNTLVRSTETALVVSNYLDPKRPVYSLAFTPDGKYLAIGREDGSIIFIDSKTGEVAIDTKEHSTSVLSIAFSEDGVYMASGSKDGTVMVWSLQALIGQAQVITTRLSGHSGPVTSVAFNKDATELASGSLDWSIILWNMEPPPAFLLAYHQGTAEIPNLFFTDKALRVADENEAVQDLDYLDGISTGSTHWKLAGSARQLESTSKATFFNAQGDLLGLNVQSRQNGRQVLGLDVSEDTGLIDWTAVKAEGYAFAYARATAGVSTVDSMFQKNWDGIKAAGILRGAYHVYDPQADVTLQIKAFVSAINLEEGDMPPVLELLDSAGVNPDQLLADVQTWMSRVEELTGFRPILRTSANLWNRITAANVQQTTLTQYSQYPLWIIEYSGQTFPSLPTGWSIWSFWQYMENGRSTGTPSSFVISRYNGSEASLEAFIQEKTASTPPMIEEAHSVDATTLHDLFTGKQFGPTIPVADVTNVAVSPDGSLFAVGGKNGTISIFNNNGEARYPDFSIGNSSISRIIFSPDGKNLAVSNEDGLVVYITLGETDLKRENLSGHVGKVSALAFSPDGKILASAGTDARIFLWDTTVLRAAGNPLSMPSNASVTALAFDPQGTILAAADEFNEVLLFDLNPDSLQFQACDLAGRNLTLDEWQLYFPSETYHLTCPQFPAYGGTTAP